MQNLTYIKPERITLKNHPELNEKWVQDRIAEDSSILGLGDLVLKDKERRQPKAGRLDLLLQAVDSDRRYEVEVQLGETDESHIIRCIEYWDIERKRYPQYDHMAVLVAEDVTSRFLNVIGLFNGFIPLIAIQMNALKFGDKISLAFTTVLDRLQLGYVDEDEEVTEVADRSYWEHRGTPKTVAIVDRLLDIIKGFQPDFQLKYNKYYIGLAINDQTNNFAIFRPQKNGTRLELRLPKSDQTEETLSEAGLEVLDYDDRWNRYRIKLSIADEDKHKEMLSQLLKEAYQGGS